MRLLLLLVVLLGGPVAAQHGSAAPGYYPMGYSGDMWTGAVTATDDAKREITLTYTKKEKTQTFTGVLADGFKITLADGKPHELKPSEIAPGTILRVFYMPKTKKVEGKKVKYYEIFKLEVVGGESEKKENK